MPAEIVPPAGQPAGPPSPTPPSLTAPSLTAPSAAPPTPFAEFWHYFAQNKGAVAGLGVVVALVVVALLADILAPHQPYAQYRDALLVPPVWETGGRWDYPLGTDATGRDMLSRIIHGARYSLFIGCIVVGVSMTLGTSLGLVAAYFRGALSIAIMRLMDVVLAIPSLLMALVIVAILGPGLVNAMIAVSIVYLPRFTRLARAAALGEMAKDYLTAARMTGAGTPRLMFRHILPNCMPPLIVQATLGFSEAVLDAAALGFLGMGAQPPTPEWGTMLADAREFILRAWWVVTFPGLAILVTVLAFNLMGDGLRDALDPKLKRG